MACSSRGAGRAWRWLLCVGMALAAPAAVRAADAETRVFTVSVDGKHAGEATMAITRHDDGTVTMKADTSVTVSYFFVKYRYSYSGQEVWKDGRLQRLESRTNDDGKKFNVSAVNEGNAIRLRVNSQDSMVSSDLWLSSYWCLPNVKLRNQAMTVVEPDTGKRYMGRLQHIGGQRLGIAGQAMDTQHYRVNTDNPVNVWYDASERLVRQEWVEDGHRTVLELNRIDR